MLISIIKKHWILGSLVIAMVPHPFLSSQVLAQSKTFVQPQPQILSQLTAIDYYNRGNAKRKSGDNKGAIADFNQAIEIKPDFAEAYIYRGVAKMFSGDIQGSSEDYYQAIKLNPDYASAYVHYNSGLVKVKSGDNKGAIADFNQAIKHNPDPDYADAYYNRGIAKANLGDKQGAINDFRKAAKIYQKQNNVQDYQDVMNALKKLGAPN